MKTLLDVLAETRATALAAADIRDARVAREDLTKVAAGKGKAATTLGQRIKGIFKKSPESVLREQARTARVVAMTGVLKKLPRVKSEKKFLSQLKEVSEIEKQMLSPGMNKAKLMLAGMGVAGVGLGAKEMYDRLRMRSNLAAIEKDPEIPAALRPRAKEVFKVLQRYAPSLAMDPTVSRDFTRNLIRHQAIDHAVVKDLVHAEKEVRETKSKAELIQKGMSFASGVGA
jgi:hypothetical protein